MQAKPWSVVRRVAVVAALLALALTPMRGVAEPGLIEGGPGEAAATGGGYEVVVALFGTAADGRIGTPTASGRVLRGDDRLVALPACTASACPWLPAGTGPEADAGPQTSCAEADGLCWVELTEPATGACAAAPVLEVGPLFARDNWWAPAEARAYGLPPGTPAAAAALAGADLGFGPGVSDRGEDVAAAGRAPAIGVAAGTWADLALDPAAGDRPLLVRLLWQEGLFHGEACGGRGGPRENAITTDAVNLRSAPISAADVLAIVPAGRRVAVTGGERDGFYPATHGAQAGWLAGEYVGFDAGDADALAFAGADLNLRAGPSLEAAVVGTVPAGGLVAYTGELAAGFVGVVHDGARGWVDATFLDAGGAAPVLVTASAAVELRLGPAAAELALATVPAGAGVVRLGEAVGGFLPVRVGEQEGWVAADSLG